MENVVYVNGTLVETDVQEKETKDGRVFVAGNLTVDVGSHKQVVRVFCMKNRKDGDVSGLYIGLKDFLRDAIPATVAEMQGIAPSIVNISGEIEDGSYKHRHSGAIINYPRVTGRFYRVEQGRREAGCSFSTAITVIEKRPIEDEMGNRLEVVGAFSPYENAPHASVVTFTVTDAELIQAFDTYVQPMDNVLVGGSIVEKEFEVKRESKGRTFGKAETVTRTRTLYNVTRLELLEDEMTDVDALKKRLAARKQRIEEAAQRRDNPTQSTGLGDNFGI